MARLFAALYPPPDVAARVYAACAPLRDAAPTVRWTTAPALHVTMRFFGDVAPATATGVARAIDEAAALFDPMPATIRGVGAFPSWSRARVVWAGLEGDPKLELLHHELEVRAVALGFEVEGRVFRPHLTLARLPADAGLDLRRAIRTAARGVRLREPVMIESIRLMASRLEAGGADHSESHRAQLGRIRP